MNTGHAKQVTPSARERLQQLKQWAHKVLTPGQELPAWAAHMSPVGGDAGFRNYYRLQVPEGSLLAVDAPPETEDSRAFVSIAGLLKAQGICVPNVHSVDYQSGFMLVDDLGDTLLLEALDDNSADEFYRKALDIILQIQKCEPDSLPPYSRELLMTELEIYSQWFLEELMGLEIDNSTQKQLDQLFERLTETALQQPKGVVHRDFHSRNLMVLSEGNLGVIDFQGALHGPVLYDAVSLLKDCYIRWPRHKVESWLRLFIKTHPQLKDVKFETCLKWFDWIGLQRHLKCLGIFSRLWFRDHKPQYLPEIPATFAYVLDVCERYEELAFHAQWLKQSVEPLLNERIADTRVEIEQ
ncbi:aminoglycoside phosphotransferase family protein [Endozoicomonas arenosclerae]|uniref:aminoglycoside phosphotransferase family protein n=1 Tax=Endozoicomonas arenosclerae TaxID=1633495 RepID=UPI000AEA87C5|nr:phosphotransferase [Endozoicomonas arenosclerae]